MNPRVPALLLSAIAASVLATSCSSTDDGAARPEASSQSVTASADLTNKRGAVEVDLGQRAEVQDETGALLLAVSDTALSIEGCPLNSEHPGLVSKNRFSAFIEIGAAPSTEWLWPSDFYYVDAGGKVVKNIALSDANPCSSPGSSKFIDLPANSSADGAVTLDIPHTARFIGYQSNLSGQDVRIEWRVPEGTLVTATAESTASAPKPTTEAPQSVPTTNPVDKLPNPYPNSIDSEGRATGTGGSELVGCADASLYQPGTGIYSDGSMDYAAECLQGGSMAN
ncbi:acyltransferase [Rhodococcus erythropolis]|uniref:acyltransferase n=1 Tax=Rhodococcus erythropolis TaxID=1833 RepID=UPI00404163AF